MSKVNDGGPAFPCGPRKLQNGDWAGECDGLSLRDYFAAKAVNALLTWSDANDVSAEVHAKASYDIADAMLKERTR